MKIRFPWILTRRRLLVAVILDSFLFAALYTGLFLQRFGRVSDGSIFLPILWATWLLGSYVLGRYQGVYGLRTPAGLLIVLKSVLKTFLVVGLSLTATLLYIWLFVSNIGDNLFREFLIPYVGIFGLSSLLTQNILGFWLRRKANNKNHWSFLGDYDAYQSLQYHLAWSRLPVQLYYIKQWHLNNLSDTSIVVEDFSSLTEPLFSKLSELQQKGVTVVNRQDWCEEILQRFPSEYLSNADLLQFKFSFPLNSFQSRLKRLGDVSLAALLLLITSPILLIAGLLIKIEDNGPIFYSQTRSGFCGIHYTIYKLRSMRIDAESNGIQWAKRADGRITLIGSLLRRTRLDELPQLWCVFTGSMSLIGPRPERPEFDEVLAKQIPHYHLRYRMRPGLSGWAQVNYPYGASVEDSSNKFSYDLYYLRNFSFWLDLLILFKTIRLVFNGQGSIPSTN